MALFRDSVIALLAAAGLGTILFLSLRFLLGAGRELCSPLYLVLPVGRETKDLELAAEELQRLRRAYGGPARAVLLDCGMDAEQRRMAEILQREDPLLLLLCGETLLTQMEKES